MITKTLNDSKPISILIKEKDLISVKAILNFLTEKYKNFWAIKFTTGKIGEDFLVSFRVSSNYYPKVLEKFAYNNIPIILKDKNIIGFINEKKEQKRKKLRAQGWSEIAITTKQVSMTELKKLVKNGKVKEVAKEAKGGLRSNPEIVKSAKELLSETIRIAIENLVKYAEERIGKRQEAIDQLLLIATDKDLKLFQKNEEMSHAGNTAIELSFHNNYQDNLILIANNTKLNNFTNIKAAISIAEIFFNSNEEIKILPFILKNLNTRWLKIAFETVQQKLTNEEKEILKNFLASIENKRKAA